MPVPQSLLAVSQRFPPCTVWTIPPGVDRYKVTDWTAEEHLCWREEGHDPECYDTVTWRAESGRCSVLQLRMCCRSEGVSRF